MMYVLARIPEMEPAIQVRNVVTRVVQALVRAQMGLVSAVHLWYLHAAQPQQKT